MMGIKFTGKIPFKEIYIHGLVRDSHGQKMSKSKGNVLDPIDLIDGISLEDLVAKRTSGLMQPQMATKIEKQTRKDYPDGIPSLGTDALRFTFASLASTGRDINFDLQRIEGYRNFCNKLWNAARYVLMNTEGEDCGQKNESVELNSADKWIISLLQSKEQEIEKSFKTYRLDFIAQSIYEFTWNEYCDWYLELSKSVLSNENSSKEQLRGTRQTLVRVLETLLRLAHPVIPYITEEIWQRVAPLAAKNGETIMLQAYPVFNADLVDQAAEQDIDWVKSFVIGVRQIRSGMNIAPRKKLPIILQNGSAQDKLRLEKYNNYVIDIAVTESIQWLDDSQQAPDSATAMLGHMKILIPMAGLIDKQAELTRLNKELEKIDKESNQVNGKLNNTKFTDKAPKEVVNKVRIRAEELKQLNEDIQLQIDRVNKMPD